MVEERLDHLMTLQEEISLAHNVSRVDSTMEILVEGSDGDISVGRSYRDAPEIDGLVVVQGELELGKMHSVRITGAMQHDLLAVPADDI